MKRPLITEKKINAGDASFGQSANDYFIKKSLEAVQNALTSIDRKLIELAQANAQHDAQAVGAPAPNYGVQTVVTPEAPAGEAENKIEASVKEQTMIFEPKSMKAEVAQNGKQQVIETNPAADQKLPNVGNGPVKADVIGAQRWHEVQGNFPQYVKEPRLTMFAIAPTKINQAAVSAFSDALNGVAGQLEAAGNMTAATQLDVLNTCIIASFEESMRVAEQCSEESCSSDDEECKK